jgi:hypothetical protein
MPRYYFHLRAREDRLHDEEGVVLPDVEAAWFQAVRSARDLIRADLYLGCGFEEQIIEIADEGGAAVQQIALNEIATYAF